MPSVKLPQDPLWYKDAIIYEVHVKCFHDSNHDGIGDFQGLIQKLDYLQDLGITCLWLLPFFPSPLRDDGYDISDYRGVHPAYGTRRDFSQLVREAHRRGIRVVIELVINHTSDQHPWFQAARRSPTGSSKRDFYVWSDTDQKYKDVRIIFKDTEKSNWTWDPVAKQYYWHRFFSHQPDLNFDNPNVRRAVMKVMRFWLDLGVDGLRLDAVPYLIERDGTNCENLTETHDILKAMRRELDSHYKGRMFLAEANQWPADVRPYFGDGDECHMAFHFPLMPRIFMALRQEDRHPVTEILRQTPEIPDNCQWAIFLRNHDELTLEMVTDSERDYMYSEYAADPLMRLNLGIRRRLAPLLNNSRRRLELLNSLLFSFPGTPVIYYGDEIGMGDNFYLGDRNGVRTPMQWSSDRNGGFSKADFARLYAPPIMDSVYSYHSVNVEAQQRDPSSLLNWMKRMISVSKRFKTFGRGKLEFLYPKNRKVLAYVRRYEDETFLAIANLSRFVQPVELDLKEFSGRSPVEMLGRVEFPPIGELPYFLTLGPHSFYWFQLQPVRERLTVEKQAPVPAASAVAAETPVLMLSEPLGKALPPAVQEWLEKEAIVRYLPRQRWYGGKAETLSSVKLSGIIPLECEGRPAFFAIVEVPRGRGKDRYTLPLILLRETEEGPGTIGRLKAPRGSWQIADAMFDDGFCRTLLAMVDGQTKHSVDGTGLQGVQTSVYAAIRGAAEEPLPVERSSAEQSNTSIRFGRRLIMKLFRRIDVGQNPDFEISRYLTEHTTFDRFPRTLGGLELQSGRDSGATLAMVQELISNQGDGWSHALDEVGRFFERAILQLSALEQLAPAALNPPKLDSAAMPPIAQDLMGSWFYAAGLLGRRTAEFHLALAQDTADAAFAPEPLDPKELDELAQKTQRYAEETLETLEKNISRLPGAHAAKAQEIVKAAAGFNAARLLGRSDAIPRGRLRIHGDFHLGQVLWTKNDFVLLDFEGEPARSLAERRRKQSPLKDVAGMIRSFHYAAYAGLFKAAAERPAEVVRLEPAARFWYAWSVSAFLAEYRKATAGAAFLPEDPAAWEGLLDFFLVDKALYEVQYELNNRPAWIPIPLEGLSMFLQSRVLARG
jgi:maltose alpha-D-glucosyltransferase / alpha-amylase